MTNGSRFILPFQVKLWKQIRCSFNNPELLNEDPYQKGWMYKIKPTSWVADTQSYFLAEDASFMGNGRNWCKIQRLFWLRSIVKYSPDPSCVILQDGGELRDQPLSDLSNEVWQDFQEEFMSKKVLCRNVKNVSGNPEELRNEILIYFKEVTC